MRLEERLAPDILRSEVNGLIGAAFIGAFVLGAGLILWHAAFDRNPIADALANALYAQTHEPQ